MLVDCDWATVANLNEWNWHGQGKHLQFTQTSYDFATLSFA